MKICGLTRAQDVRAASQAGADLVGFVLAPSSRQVSWDQLAELVGAIPNPSTRAVAVLVNPRAAEVDRAFASGAALVQLHGQESPEFCRRWQDQVIKAVSVDSPLDLERARRYGHCHVLLLDSARPGSGQSWDYRWLAGFELPYLLAGGLGPDSLEQALRGLTPYGVDASSSLESGPGRKDPERMRRFIETARRCV